MAELGIMEPLLTIRQVCQILNVHANTLRNWDKQGRLASIRIGVRGDRRYRKQDILRLFDVEQEGVIGVERGGEGKIRGERGMKK